MQYFIVSKKLKRTAASMKKKRANNADDVDNTEPCPTAATGAPMKKRAKKSNNINRVVMADDDDDNDINANLDDNININDVNANIMDPVQKSTKTTKKNTSSKTTQQGVDHVDHDYGDNDIYASPAGKQEGVPLRRSKRLAQKATHVEASVEKKQPSEQKNIMVILTLLSY